MLCKPPHHGEKRHSPAGSQDPAQVLDLLGLALEHGRVREHLVDHGIVDHALGAAGEAQRVARLVRMDGCGGDVADDGRLGVAAQGGLQDACQLGVPVRDVAPCGAPSKGSVGATLPAVCWV